MSVPAAFSKHPVLVCDFNDRSLYILVGAEKESAVWKSNIEVIAFNNSNVLSEKPTVLNKSSAVLNTL